MENGFWFALLTITLAIIGWGINKYIEHLELSRLDERRTSEQIKEDTSLMLNKINIQLLLVTVKLHEQRM